ncbi:lysophospholipid acyltransferase family protein [Blastococcus brunescens]|uniref:Lysophospholipid acyltransferase family protein n=1 Tax=Blastococcus brunescens TaxID=1564165 RepID=A0ABZ1AYN9_9ACTN|nr:lysophospholipid acyltransferase family protein [Blastococcus sp. BMG 8361]WRL62596.1 lysophospholipid acyltransferase family protein [Blastococcus sp. BMG 8361]
MGRITGMTGGQPVGEQTSSGQAGARASAVARRVRTHPAKWRTRGRLTYGMVAAIVVIYPVSSLMFRLRYRHGGRLPANGPVLLVANHISILDPLACARLVFDNGRLPHFLAKESVFTGFAGTLLRSAGQIPVARFSDSAHEALEAATADLDAGNVVVIYPEGSVTRDPDWWPMQSRTGVARLALTTDAVVLPVAQWGPQEVHDYHRRQLRLRFRAPADYLVGEPVDLADQRSRVRAGHPLTAELLRETTDLIMTRVREGLAELRDEPAPPTFHPRPRRELPGDVSGSAA